MIIKSSENLSNLFLLLCLFPYVSLINTPFDTQPYALICSFVVIGVAFLKNSSIKIPLEIFIMTIIIIYAVLISVLRGTIESEYFLRSMVGYISLPAICLASYITFKHAKGKIIFFTACTWFIFGIIQATISKTFGGLILPRLSTSEDRGVTSLAVEPSAYSIICIFLLILNDLMLQKGEYSKRKYNLILVLLIFQLILAKAALGTVLLIIYILVKIMTKINLFSFIKYLTLFSILIWILNYMFITFEYLRYSRLGTIIYKLNYSPEKLIFTDGSISDRLSHILLSFHSILNSKGIGFGLGSWDQSVGEVISTSNDFLIQLVQVNFTLGRIMSGWGSMVFEIGIFGLIVMIMYLLLGAKFIISKKNSVNIQSIIVVFFIMLTSVSLSFPLFGYMFGAFLAIYNEPRIRIEE